MDIRSYFGSTSQASSDAKADSDSEDHGTDSSLTGIGRFYEMSYILQLLMEHDQFESLLHTGMEKVHFVIISIYSILTRSLIQIY